MQINGKPPRVFLACPSRPGDSAPFELIRAIFDAGKGFDLSPNLRSCSLLTTNFNILWCDALNANPRPDRFVMIHSDVAPEPGWVEALVAEQDRAGADVLSVVIPLKDETGTTSTGIMDARTTKMRKLTLHQIFGDRQLPTSFTAKDVTGNANDCLLMNTGLWICDFTRPWVEKIAFRQNDAIRRGPDGKWKPESVSEDWLFSIDCWRLGLRCFATTALKLHHQGTFGYPNYAAWGTREDEGKEYLPWNVEPPNGWTGPREKSHRPEWKELEFAEQLRQGGIIG